METGMMTTNYTGKKELSQAGCEATPREFAE